jgi:geranylgeranyl reductase family protein
MSSATDVVIVGAGPAGATAARTLALAGARVKLLDRAKFPRNKPCGGAISMRALGRFPYLRASMNRIETRLISRLHLESPSGETVQLQSDEPAALMIRRIEFDRLLVGLAQEAGADLIEGAEVTQAERTRDAILLTTRSGARISAPLVIAADGANSVVAKRLGLNRRWPANAVALDMMEETPVDGLMCGDPDSLWVAYGYKNSHGYAYVFPKRRHVNVGIGYILDHYRRAIGSPPYDLQRRFVGSLCRQGVLHGQSDRRHFTPAYIPVGGPLKVSCAAKDRVMLVGDAGGFVNGFTAEGIYYGMVSGDLAGRAIATSPPSAGRAFSCGKVFRHAWRREIGAELRDSVLVQRFLFRNPTRIDEMVKQARMRGDLTAAVIRYALGRQSYHSARWTLLWRCPGLAFRLLFDTQLSAESVRITAQ